MTCARAQHLTFCQLPAVDAFKKGRTPGPNCAETQAAESGVRHGVGPSTCGGAWSFSDKVVLLSQAATTASGKSSSRLNRGELRPQWHFQILYCLAITSHILRHSSYLLKHSQEVPREPLPRVSSLYVGAAYAPQAVCLYECRARAVLGWQQIACK